MRVRSVSNIMANVHEEKVFVINETDLSPSASGVVNCVITATTKDLHIVIEGLANSGGLFRTFGAPTFTGGTPYVPFNRVVGSSVNSTATVLVGVTGLSGNTRGDLPIIGSSGFFSTSGGSQGSELESIIPKGMSLGVEVETGSAGEPIAIICDFYEGE